MNRELIAQWAREAGWHVADTAGDMTLFHVWSDQLGGFAAKVAAHEREQCALICDEKARGWKERPVPLLGFSAELEDCAAAIRARPGEKHDRP